MKKIVIIGGGFAGLTAAISLSKKRDRFEVILIDKKSCFNALPALPDVISARISPESIELSLSKQATTCGFTFLHNEVRSLDCDKKKVTLKNSTIGFDYLVVASGTQTNFYGNTEIEKNAYTLDCVEDARALSNALKKKDIKNIVIAGGGYTGIEIATHIRRFFGYDDLSRHIIIVEKAAVLLGPLPQYFKAYAQKNIEKLNVEVILDASVEKIEKDTINISNGLKLEKAMLIWCAGVRTPDFFNNLDVEKNNQGRIKVNEFLIFNEYCFAIGDSALFYHKGKPLRMAVQFAIAQAELLVHNIKQIEDGKELKKFKPVDYGYIIPMANSRSCGEILGVVFYGLIPTWLHYFMCIFRNFGIRNRLRVIKDLFTGKK